ncbi:MAG: hypothetical protein GF418_09895 [Chitinivibrionales bacterium]|nr:hypothetical protein [Chitinivibrionales bacterium]MBD3395923.1 hypothetical protein [Chitinivibrionales bacterium]
MNHASPPGGHPSVKSPAPVFVLGSARSGTTWLGNLLCGHPAVAGAEHELHWGLHESNVFLNQRHWGDLTRPPAFEQFMSAYCDADYFRLVDGDPGFLRDAHPGDFYDAFFALMDRFAARQSARWWVTKLDYLLYYRPAELERFVTRVRARYGAFVCIAVTRADRLATMASYIRMEGKRRQHRTNPVVKVLLLALHAARMTCHEQGIRALAGRHGGLSLTLEQLKANRRASCESICRFLNLDYHQSMMTDRYAPNSSYNQSPDSRGVLAAWHRDLLSRVLFPLYNRLPGVAALFLKLREIPKFRACPLYFRLKKRDADPGRLAKELSDEGEVSLAALVAGTTRASGGA